ncbi:hypothetical protein DFH07DRAFT_875555, partial [Mycena maculata]
MDPAHRAVYLPLRKLEKCDSCAKTEALRLCAACGECTYCSPKCQKDDWPNHKTKCGKTDRIDLEKFYPFLACMAEESHRNKPLHPAMTHMIINSPNPGSHPMAFPDGSAANLVMLGDPIDVPIDIGSPNWWPTATSDKVRSKMLRRLLREGCALAVATSICLALLSEMYTTTAVSAADSPDGKLKRRTRLTYKSSPIADFGIATGSADVKNQDKLAYFNLSDMSFTCGQDPNDHYWIYFTTIRGEDVLLDCAMFTFNMCLIVNAAPYEDSMPSVAWAPAFFRERTMEQLTPDLHTERKRVSVLRNADMHQAVMHALRGFDDPDVALVCVLMETLAGRRISDIERDLTFRCAVQHCTVLAKVLGTRAWTGWPAPEIAIESDPGELNDLMDEENDEAWFKYMKKWRNKYKKGNADREALGVAFREWEAKNAEKKR